MTALQSALQAHQRGALEEARRLYLAAIDESPTQLAAFRGLGTLEIQVGRLDQGIELLRQCLRSQPGDIAARINLGIALRRRGEDEAALGCFDEVLKLDGTQAEAWFNRGLCLKRLGRLIEAQDAYERALAIRPQHLSARINLGNLLLDQSAPEAALAVFKALSQMAPGHAAGWDGVGRALLVLDNLDKSLRAFDQAVQLEPNNASYHLNRASVLNRLERYDEALVACERCLALAPDTAGACVNAGNAQRGRGNWQAAVSFYRQAAECEPGNPDMLELMGYCHLQLKAYEDAGQSYARSTQLRPLNADAWAHLGLAEAGAGQFNEAEAAFRRALELDVANEVALIGLPAALRDQHRWQEALTAYDLACRHLPDSAEAQYNRALCQLTLGDVQSAWGEYEARLRLPSHRRRALDLEIPLWDGSIDVRDKSILLTFEQGLGDAIQFMRFVEPVAKRAKHVYVVLPEALAHLRWQGIPRNVTLTASLTPTSVVDFRCSLMSLPWVLGIKSLEPIPQPYIAADAAKVARWDTRLEMKKRPRLGLVVSGNPSHVNDHYRSLPLDTFLATMPREIDWVLLQQVLRPGDREALSRYANCQFFGDDLVDFTDTAALASCMDLIVSVDTSVAHLCGAMGMPTWVLLAFNADWRWQTHRTDSPWYPSMRLFRQTAHDDWHPLLTTIGKTLSQS